jgi:hypothetical protein
MACFCDASANISRYMRWNGVSGLYPDAIGSSSTTDAALLFAVDVADDNTVDAEEGP